MFIQSSLPRRELKVVYEIFIQQFFENYIAARMGRIDRTFALFQFSFFSSNVAGNFFTTPFYDFYRLCRNV